MGRKERIIILSLSILLICVLGVSAVQVNLTRTNNGWIKDDGYKEAAAINTAWMEVSSFNSSNTGEVAIFSLNLSGIPAGSTIDKVNISLMYIGGTSFQYNEVWISENETWVEGTFDNICPGGGFCQALIDFFDHDTEYRFRYTFTNVVKVVSDNITNIVNARFAAGQRNITFLLNTTNTSTKSVDWGAKENAAAANRPYALVDYTPPSGVVEGFEEFVYPYYSFKISNLTGELTNITVSGRTVPVIEQVDHVDYDHTGSGYDIANVTINVIKNGSLYDIITVNYFYEIAGTYYGLCNDTYNLFADSNIIYAEHQCRQYDEILSICENQERLLLPNANSTHRLYGAATWQKRVFNSTGTYILNTTIQSGTGTSSSAITPTYIMAANGTNGYAIFGTLRFSSNAGDGMNRQHNPTYLTADTNDTNEWLNNIYGDYLVAYPNISLYADDDVTTTKVLTTHFKFEGLSGYTPPAGTTCALRPAWDEKTELKGEMAKDMFRTSFFILVGNETDDFETEAETLHDNIFYETKGRSTITNARYIQWYGQGQDMSASWHGEVDYFFGWHTTQYSRKLLQDDTTSIIVSNEITNHFKMFHCYQRLYEKLKDGGWWAYDNIDYSSLYKGDTYFGNAIESMDSCFFIEYSSYLDDFPDERQAIRNMRLNYTAPIALNPNTDLINRKLTIDARITDDTVEYNMSTMPKPSFNITAKPYPFGGFVIYAVDNSGPAKYLVSRISCNASDGTYLWEDSFVTDNSTSYNLTGFSYNAGLDGLYRDGTGTIRPSYTKTDSSDWVNYTCSFDIEAYYNTTSTTNDYVMVALRYNSSDAGALHAAKNGVRYSVMGLDTSIMNGGSSKYAWWALRDEIAGVFDNRWTTANASAWMPIYAPQQPIYRPDSSNIINQGNYFSIDLVDQCREAILGGNHSVAALRCSQVNNIMGGYNWLNTHQPDYFGTDGFWKYSTDNPGHDSGYLTNSVLQMSKIIRGANGTRFYELPALSYYIRHGRHNSSEGSASNAWVKYMAMLGAVDSRITQFMWNGPLSSQLIGIDNYVMSLFPDDMNKSIGFKNSSCTDVFAGQMGIYYVDDHTKLDHDGMAYLEEKCNPIRVSAVSNATIQDAYQTEDTTNTTILISPYPYPCNIWHQYGYMDGETTNESYPRGLAYCGADSTFWNVSAHAWMNNVTKYDSFSYDISNATNMSVMLVYANESENYSVYLNSSYVGSVYTDMRGFSNLTTFTLSGGGEVWFLLGGAPAAPAPVPVTNGTQLTYINITNGSTVNLSVLAGYVAGRFVSWNYSNLDLMLYVNGSLANHNSSQNNTWFAFSSVNFSTVGTKLLIVNTTWNTTAMYVLYVTNTTTANTSSTPSTTTGCCESYIGISILIAVFLVFLVLLADRTQAIFFVTKKGAEIPILKYFILVFAGWVGFAVLDVALGIIDNESISRMGAVLAIYKGYNYFMYFLSAAWAIMFLYLVLIKLMDWGGNDG